jgi:hypothetical protein
MSGAAARLRREHNTTAWLAWHVEALARSKRLPKLKSLLVGGGKPRPQTWQEQKAIGMMWQAVITKGAKNG